MATDRMRLLPSALALLLVHAAVPAQDLHRGLIEADLVAVARQVGKEDASPDLTIHRVQILGAIRGVPAGATAVSVLDWPKLSMHNRPQPRQSRLYCLQDAKTAAERAGLPADKGPYFRMVGWDGTNPLIGPDLDADPIVKFARLLAAADAGSDATATTAALVDTVLNGTPAVRTEAARVLAERPDLRSRIAAVQWSRVLSRVSGEAEDVAYKIALAELCAEQRLPGLAEAMVVGASAVQDIDYLRTTGRLTAILKGEQATPMILEQVQIARDPRHRQALLLVLGATQTQSALDALLDLRKSMGADKAIEAALAEHKSRAAREATMQGKKDK
jgi:hypothetical protein